MASKLTSVEELKTLLRIPATETVLDAEFGLKIEEASAECESFTSRTFLKTGYANETYVGGGDSVVLKNYPVDSAATFQLKANDDAIITIYDPSDYVVDYAAGIVRLRGGLVFPVGPDGVLVTYTAGYAQSGTGTTLKVTVPGDLSSAVRELAAARYRYQLGIITTEELKAARQEAQIIWARYARLW